MSREIQGDITKAGIRLLLEEPFFGHIFSGLSRELNDQIDNISIGISDGRPTLVVQPSFWIEQDDENVKAGYIKHQLLHLSLKHPFMRDDFSNKHIFDIAADIVVNQFIQPSQLAPDAITLEHYPQLKLKRGEDVGYYYREIMNIMKKGNAPDSFPDENHEQLKQHRNWSSLGDTQRMDRRMMEAAVNDALVQAAERSDEKLQGLLPGHLLRLIREKLERAPKQVDWRRVLRLFLGTGRKTYLKNTIRRPSKRYGTNPGITVRQKQKILVGLDTSGSVSPKEIALFFSEMKHIQRQGSEVMVAECDAQLHRTYLLGKRAPLEVAGSGGTNFTPVIAYANDEYHPDMIVYFTDGFGNNPEIKPKCPILWMVSKDGITPSDHYWKDLIGRKVKMNA